MNALELESAKRTNENSPAPLVLGSVAIRAAKPVKRATENGLWLTRIADSLSSASRTKAGTDDMFPAMNRWAIFGRPLHGLLMTTSSFMNNPG